MIYFAIKWFLCVGGAWLLIFYGIKLFGADSSVIQKHFMPFCLLAFVIAAMTVYAGEKPRPPEPPEPPQPPTPQTVTNLYFKCGVKGSSVIPYQTPIKELPQ